jgi:DNA-binding transcriptional LysR family regulator
MELRHLRYFLAVAEELSFTRAAMRLHIAQPALSVQIKRLEDELGVQLLDRSRRAVRLTEAGDVLVGEARRVLAGVDQAVLLVRRTGTGAVGRLTVGFVPSAANMALPPLLRAFGQSSPEVDVNLREMAPDALVRALHEGRLDVCFIYLPFDDPSLDSLVVARDSFVIALPSDHPLASCDRVDVCDLAEEPFILPARHGMPGLHAQVLDICREAGFTPQAVQEDVWLVQTIVGLVAGGAGVALVPASAHALAHPDVVYRPLRGRTAHVVELAAVWRPGEATPVARRFLEQIAAVTTEPTARRRRSARRLATGHRRDLLRVPGAAGEKD